MKNLFLIPCLFLFSFLQAQNIEGAWKLVSQNGKNVEDELVVKIIQDGYFSFGAKDAKTDQFIGAGGGEYQLSNNHYRETLDFYTKNPDWVGQTTDFSFDLVSGKMVIATETESGSFAEVWERISEEVDALTGNWVFTGRKTEGEIRRSTPGARRTVKILSGGKFQWIAFNSETKEFMGTGGGSYEAIDGNYTEKIEFFSRDNGRVGAQLAFNFEVIDGEWHHSGLSSTGAPIYEIWSKYRKAYSEAK
jgi:hypothetical protein